MAAPARARLGALLLEAAMVVFAVLVALAVDEWRAERELREQVVRARAAIEAELRSNREELRQGAPSVEAFHDQVRGMVSRLRAGEQLDSWELRAYIPDFTDAAWETARSTGVMAHMDYDWVLSTARIYEAQALATTVQNGLLDMLGSLIVRAPELERTTDLQGRLAIMLELYSELERKLGEGLDSPRNGEGP